jgi:hypothetical protein
MIRQNRFLHLASFVLQPCTCPWTFSCALGFKQQGVCDLHCVLSSAGPQPKRYTSTLRTPPVSCCTLSIAPSSSSHTVTGTQYAHPNDAQRILYDTGAHSQPPSTAPCQLHLAAATQSQARHAPAKCPATCLTLSEVSSTQHLCCCLPHPCLLHLVDSMRMQQGVRFAVSNK